MDWYRLGDRAEKIRPFSVIIGGRGIGKTYSAIDFLINEGKPFIYLRNTEVQIDESSTDFGNPFKRWAKDHDRNISIIKEKRHSVIIERLDSKSNRIGYAAALSTFANLRGVDLSDVIYVLFDEFIERRPLTFAQFDAFANFYETVNRNRELLGEEPLKVIMLSNAQKLDNPILAGYRFIPIIENMILHGQRERVSKDYYIALPESKVSEAKRQTANYQLTKDTYFNKEALDNKFAYDSFRGIKKRPLKEYTAVCSIDGIYIYRHKSTGRYYACRSQSTAGRAFNSKDERLLFMRTYGLTLQMADVTGTIDYSDFATKAKLSGIIDNSKN